MVPEALNNDGRSWWSSWVAQLTTVRAGTPVARRLLLPTGLFPDAYTEKYLGFVHGTGPNEICKYTELFGDIARRRNRRTVAALNLLGTHKLCAHAAAARSLETITFQGVSLRWASPD